MDKLNVASFGLVLLLSFSRSVHCEDDSSEERSGVPIIRQINKVNDDGTYTYGYEAADGSFKIETRDVLGNVKGMFGFMDESGKLKRVSYTANNETGFRNSVIHTPTPSAFKTTTEHGRKPVLILKNTPALHSPTKGPVIQHIPKKSPKEDGDELQSTTAPLPEQANGRRFPSPATNSSDKQPEAEDGSSQSQAMNPLRKILVSKRPVEDKEVHAGKGGNHFRRQLSRGVDLRGETSHIYSGGDSRFPSNIPPHLSALMSELRPVQVVRMTPESISYQTVDVEAASQEIHEIPTTTTELPYGSRKILPPEAIAYLNQRYRRPLHPPPDDSQYTSEAGQQHYRLQHVPVNVPNANYQTQPNYYEQPQQLPAVALSPSVLRDELMTIISNYLTVRLNPAQYSRYPYPSPFLNPLYTPNYAYPQPVNYPPTPYTNPYLSPLPQYYPPPFANPNSIYPAIPTQTPLGGPNVQFSPKSESVTRRLGPHRAPAIRATSPADDADLLQMLLTSPTRIPLSRLRYSPAAAERLNPSKHRQPVRNLQIISETTETETPTTDTSE